MRRTELIFTLEMFFALGFFMLLGALPVVSGLLVVSCLVSFVFAGFVLSRANAELKEQFFGYQYRFIDRLFARQVVIQFLDPLLI